MKHTFIYTPVVDYELAHQRPQGIFNALAKLGHRVFFFNWGGLRGDHHGMDFWIKEPLPNLFVLSHLQELHLHEPPIVWISYPPHWPMAEKFNPKLIVADCIDKPVGEFEAWAPNWEAMVGGADVVFASSSELLIRAAPLNENVHILPNACDFAHFSKRMECPKWMQGFPRPIYGFIGVFAGWVDFSLIESLADAQPHATILMIGRRYSGREVLSKRENIRYTKWVDYKVLPCLVQHFDVGIIPFRITEMTEAVDPIKCWEMMAAGVPVVATDLPALRGRPGVVTASSEEEFLRFCEAVAEKGLGQAGQEFAKLNTWDRRAEEALKHIEAALERKGGE